MSAATVDAEGNARVEWLTDDDHFRLTVEWDLPSPIGGPSRIEIRAVSTTDDTDNPIGGYGTDGIGYAQLRTLPIRESARMLQDLWIEHEASKIIGSVPDPFTGEVAYARLAHAFVMLDAQGIRRPVAAISKARPNDTPAAWAARVKRARSDGYLGESVDSTGRKRPTLTGKSLQWLGAGV